MNLISFEAFTAFEYNKVFSGNQLVRMEQIYILILLISLEDFIVTIVMFSFKHQHKADTVISHACIG